MQFFHFICHAFPLDVSETSDKIRMIRRRLACHCARLTRTNWEMVQPFCHSLRRTTSYFLLVSDTSSTQAVLCTYRFLFCLLMIQACGVCLFSMKCFLSDWCRKINGFCEILFCFPEHYCRGVWNVQWRSDSQLRSLRIKFQK